MSEVKGTLLGIVLAISAFSSILSETVFEARLIAAVIIPNTNEKAEIAKTIPNKVPFTSDIVSPPF